MFRTSLSFITTVLSISIRGRSKCSYTQTAISDFSCWTLNNELSLNREGEKDESLCWWKCVRGEKDKVPHLWTLFSSTCNIKLGYFTTGLPDTQTNSCFVTVHLSLFTVTSQRQHLLSVVPPARCATHGPRSLLAPWMTAWWPELSWQTVRKLTHSTKASVSSRGATAPQRPQMMQQLQDPRWSAEWEQTNANSLYMLYPQFHLNLNTLYFLLL